MHTGDPIRTVHVSGEPRRHTLHQPLRVRSDVGSSARPGPPTTAHQGEWATQFRYVSSRRAPVERTSFRHMPVALATTIIRRLRTTHPTPIEHAARERQDRHCLVDPTELLVHHEVVSVSPRVSSLGHPDRLLGTIRLPIEVLDYIEIGRAEGATLAAQAPLPSDPRLAGGSYIPPTLFVDVAPEMRIAREEIFGPVVALIPFADEAEAVRIANESEFGLVAGVFSADSERSMRVARAIRCGMVFVNNYNRAFTGAPFGGIGASGFGREHAMETLHEFGYSKSLRIPTGAGPVPRWAPSLEVTAAPAD